MSDESNKLRGELINCVNTFAKKKLHLWHTDAVIMSKISATDKFVKDNKNILFTKADKGNVTIAIERENYNKKVLEVLSDDKYYKQLSKSPLNILKKSVDLLIKKWINLGVCDLDSSFNILKTNDNNTDLACAYGLIKLHKKDLPVKIIVSTVNSPTY